MNLWQEGTTLHLDGTMTYVMAFGASTTYTGGWTYSDATGPLLDPASDVGFQDAVADMFNLTVPPDATAAAGGFWGTVISLIGNITQITINYIINIGIPYTPPITCLGPRILTGPNDCGPGALSCEDQLVEMCQSIGDLPNVSNAFRKCMKGRCGCSGSTFSRTRITCASQSACGPCGSGAGGCSLGGTTNWYCGNSGTVPCKCVDTVFQEMAHSCGAMHSAAYFSGSGCTNQDVACTISGWFKDQCISRQGTAP